MRERGMIFNSEMVKAILDGRKTQTRRILTVQPEPSKTRPGEHWFSSKKLETMVHLSDLSPGNCAIADSHLFYLEHCCPFGQPGDRLWVRETWQAIHDYCDENGNVDERRYPRSIPKQRGNYWHPVYAEAWGNECREDRQFPWRPAIHMPRWASRITLEITGVRVERLQNAEESSLLDELGDMLEDCDSVAGRAFNYAEHYAIAGVPVGMSPEMHGFKAWWDKVNGYGSFDSNPWVWVVDFKRVEQQP